MDSKSDDDDRCAGCAAAAAEASDADARCAAAEPEDQSTAGMKRKSPCTPSESCSHDTESSEGEDAETVETEAYHAACRKAYLEMIIRDRMPLSIGERQGFKVFYMVFQCLRFGDYLYDACKKILVQMIIKDGMPFKTVEGAGFKQFVKALEPRFEIPSCKSISSEVLSMYLSEKQKMKDYFAENRTRVCLAIDKWTTIENLYLRITAHFIDSDWKFHKRIINFSEIESGTSANIGKTLEKCLLELGIDKVFTVTLDNTNANATAIECLKDRVIKNNVIMNAEFLQVKCPAHVLAHVVKAGLKKYRKSISKIRAVVKYVLTKSFKFRDCVAKEKIECKKGLVLDEKNRWNSTYLMLEAAVKFEKAFQRLEKEETKFFTKFCSSPSTGSTFTSTVDKEASTLDIEEASSSDSLDIDEASSSDEEVFSSDYESDEALAPGYKSSSSDSESDEETSYAEDWSYARNFSKFLKVFLDATMKLTASTSDSFLWQHCVIHKQFSTWVNSEDPFLKKMANAMFHKYNKYWGSYEDMNPFLLIAVLLDPREKELGLKFRLDVLCEKDEDLAVKLMSRVKSVLEKLYKEYKLLYSGAENVGAETSNLHDTEKKDCDDNAEALLSQRLEKLRYETVDYKSEVDRYLAEPCEGTRDNPQFDLLDWWKTNSTKYGILSYIARDILAIPVSSITPKSAFNTGRCALDEFRSSLSPRTVEALICMQSRLCLTTDLDLSGLVDDDDVDVDDDDDEEEEEDTDPRTVEALICMQSWLG